MFKSSKILVWNSGFVLWIFPGENEGGNDLRWAKVFYVHGLSRLVVVLCMINCYE